MGKKNVVRPVKNRRFLNRNGPFFSARSRSSRRNNMILANVQDIRRKWAKIGLFFLKFGGHFIGIRAKKTRFIASGMGDFARVRSKPGSRQAWTTPSDIFAFVYVFLSAQFGISYRFIYQLPPCPVCLDALLFLYQNVYLAYCSYTICLSTLSGMWYLSIRSIFSILFDYLPYFPIFPVRSPPILPL